MREWARTWGWPVGPDLGGGEDDGPWAMYCGGPFIYRQPVHLPWTGWRRFFIFIFLKIIFYRNIFSVSQFTGLYPYCPAGGGRGPTACLRGGRPPAGCRGLYVIKICVLSHGCPYRPAGGRQAPPNIKAEAPPAFAANNIHRGQKERRGVRERVATAKPCRILDPNRR